jgi:hypothetical protein
VRAQGWYRDPYGRHGERWVSGGRPTTLVRDGDAESYDPPGAEESPVPEDEWQPVPESARAWHELPTAPWPGRPILLVILVLLVLFLAIGVLYALAVASAMNGFT